MKVRAVRSPDRILPRVPIAPDDASAPTPAEPTRAALQELLQRSEDALALLDAVFASAPVGLNFVDRELRYVRINPYLAAMNNLSPEAHVGRTLGEVLGPLAAEVEPHYRRVFETGEPVLGLEVTGERPGSHERSHWHVSYYPVRVAGRVRYVGAVVADVTDRTQREQGLRFLAEASVALTRSLDVERTLKRIAQLAVPALADWAVIDIVGESGAIQRVAVVHQDPAKVAFAAELERRYPPDPDATTGVAQVLRTGRSEWMQEIPDALIEAATRDPEQLRLLRALGLTSYIVAPMNARGRTLGAITLVTAESRRHYGPADVALAEDLAQRAALALDNARLYHAARVAEEAVRAHAETLESRVRDRTRELESMNEALQESSGNMEAFTFSVSHDLRAPLRHIQGYAEALLDDYRGVLDARGIGYAERMIQSAQQMDALIRDLLDYSQMTRSELPREIVPLRDVVTTARESVTAEWEQTNPEFEVAPDLPAVVGQRAVLVQALGNLLGNAVKFVAPGVRPHVRVWAERRGPNVRLWIEDNGIGIAPEHREVIFGVFQRLHGLQAYPGTGVGLAIVRKAMERLGGHTGVESVPGHGSRFWIELPAAEDQG